MLKKRVLLIFYILVFSSLLLNSQLSLAATIGGETGGGGAIDLPNPIGSKSIIDILNKVLNYLIYISIPFLALFILIGGFQILFARGSAEKVKAGRQTIQWAVIGFTIILVSKGVALILLQILS